MHFSTAIALAACFRIVASTPAVIPKGPGRTKEEPDVPGSHYPYSPNDPDPGTPGGTAADPLPEQQDIEMSMGNTELRLKDIIPEGGKMVASIFANGTEDIVSAMLETPSCTWPEPTATVGGFSQVAEYEDCTSAKFTPKTTLPATSFTNCQDYASTLSSCASVTPSFYSLDATVQASCACYSTPATYGGVCDGTQGAQQTAVPTLVADSFDNVASMCYSFFNGQGYENVAKMLSGREGNQTRLGSNFCANLSQDLKRQGGNASAGLKPELDGIEFTNCESYYPQPAPTAAVSGGSWGYAALGDGVMGVGFVFVTVVPLLVL